VFNSKETKEQQRIDKSSVFMRFEIRFLVAIHLTLKDNESLVLYYLQNNQYPMLQNTDPSLQSSF